MKETYFLVECVNSSDKTTTHYKFDTIAKIDELIEGFSEGWEFTIYGLSYKVKK